MINVSQRLRDCQKATCVLICLLLWEDLKPVSTTVLPTSFYVLKLYFRTIVLDLFFTTVARLSNVYLWIYMHAVVKGIETSLYAVPLWNYRNPENLQTENWKKKQYLFWIPSLVFFLWLCVFRGLERPPDQNGKPPNFNHGSFPPAFRTHLPNLGKTSPIFMIQSSI